MIGGLQSRAYSVERSVLTFLMPRITDQGMGFQRQLWPLIKPHTVLISAGVDNKYGHPDSEAIKLFKSHAKEYFATCWGEGGQSLKTVANKDGINTYKFTL